MSHRPVDLPRGQVLNGGHGRAVVPRFRIVRDVVQGFESFGVLTLVSSHSFDMRETPDRPVFQDFHLGPFILHSPQAENCTNQN